MILSPDDGGSLSMKLFHREFGGAGKQAPGGAGKPPLIIIHGLLGSSKNWQTTAPELAHRFHVYAVDLRNHGGSPHAPEMTFPLLSADILEWADDRGLSSFSILGHSLGGKVAMRVACDAPERVRALYVIDIAPRDYGLGSRELEAMLKLDLQALTMRRDAEERLAADIPEVWARRFLLTNLVRRASGEFSWQPNLPVITATLPAVRKTPLEPHERFAKPALFVVGGKSQFVVEDDKAIIRRHFPQAKIVTLPRSGHFPHVEDRGGLVEAVIAFADAVDAAEAGGLVDPLAPGGSNGLDPV